MKGDLSCHEEMEQVRQDKARERVEVRVGRPEIVVGVCAAHRLQVRAVNAFAHSVAQRFGILQGSRAISRSALNAERRW